MAVFALDDRLAFPDPGLAEPSGLLAIDGDLSPERLILAYSMGIFPWYSEDEPICWWSPEQRMLLYPSSFKLSKSLRLTIAKEEFEVRFDSCFREVIASCSTIKRDDQNGTWITQDMIEAYVELHALGLAHSVEVFMDDELAGGLYGVSLGKAFFGESMFHKKRDASKIALYYLVQKIITMDFHFIDAQVETAHLKSLGARNIPRKQFLNELKEALTFPTIQGKW